MNTEADTYLRSVVNRSRAPDILLSDFRLGQIMNFLHGWSGTQLVEIIKSGSSAKGTAITHVSDIDLFISLKADTTGTLRDIYNSLESGLRMQGFSPRRQNVSLGVSHLGLEIDLVPGRRQSGYQNWHSIYVSKKDSWQQTNIVENINRVRNSNRIEEIILAKVWRQRNGLDFPSIYLELSALQALNYKSIGDLSNNFWALLAYLRDSFTSATIVDPTNSGNIISDTLNQYEKQRIADAAAAAMRAQYWSQVV